MHVSHQKEFNMLLISWQVYVLLVLNIGRSSFQFSITGYHYHSVGFDGNYYLKHFGLIFLHNTGHLIVHIIDFFFVVSLLSGVKFCDSLA
jgi:hypothetical protein